MKIQVLKSGLGNLPGLEGKQVEKNNDDCDIKSCNFAVWGVVEDHPISDDWSQIFQVGLGGVFRMETGTAKAHVNPDMEVSEVWWYTGSLRAIRLRYGGPSGLLTLPLAPFGFLKSLERIARLEISSTDLDFWSQMDGMECST